MNFGVVLLVLYFFALKPLAKLMQDRTEKIEKGVTDARKSSELLEKAAEEYKQNTLKLRQASADAQKELAQELERLRAKNLERIKADNDEWVKKKTAQMETDKRALVEGAKAEIVSLAMLAAEKIMRKEDLKTLK